MISAKHSCVLVALCDAVQVVPTLVRNESPFETKTAHVAIPTDLYAPTFKQIHATAITSSK